MVKENVARFKKIIALNSLISPTPQGSILISFPCGIEGSDILIPYAGLLALSGQGSILASYMRKRLNSVIAKD